MNWKKITMVVIGLSFVALALYDVFAIVKGGTEASISHIMITYAYKFPVFPLAVGIIIGHLFWRMKSTNETRKTIDKK